MGGDFFGGGKKKPDIRPQSRSCGAGTHEGFDARPHAQIDRLIQLLVRDECLGQLAEYCGIWMFYLVPWHMDVLLGTVVKMIGGY